MKRSDARNCKTLADVRREIDTIDRELMQLVAERSTFVRRAAELKARREDILDPARIEAVVAEVKREAESKGINAEVAAEAFRAMIDRFVAYEFREFDRKKGG